MMFEETVLAGTNGVSHRPLTGRAVFRTGSELMSCCVSGQELLHGVRQLLRTIGSGQDLPKRTIVEAERRAEPRGVKDPNIGPQPSCPFGELDAVGLAGHHNIGEKEI